MATAWEIFSSLLPDELTTVTTTKNHTISICLGVKNLPELIICYHFSCYMLTAILSILIWRLIFHCRNLVKTTNNNVSQLISVDFRTVLPIGQTTLTSNTTSNEMLLDLPCSGQAKKLMKMSKYRDLILIKLYNSRYWEIQNNILQKNVTLHIFNDNIYFKNYKKKTNN